MDGKQRCLERGRQQHIHDINLNQRSFASVNTAFEDGECLEVVGRYAQCFGNQRGQRVFGVLQR